MTDLTGLEVANLSVQYGGIRAVEGVSLAAPLESVTGLIGPNGAGKTSLFNACSGFVPSAEGSISLFGRDVTKSAPEVRAQAGLGRTFQRMQLFESLSVEVNVETGAEAAIAGSSLFRQLWARASEMRRVADSTEMAIGLTGIHDLRHRNVSSLSTGQRRLVEFARALACRPRILLMDEPSSGLDRAETKHFAAVIRRVLDQGSLGVLLVEHDMSLVDEVCSKVFVVDFGRLIFEGTMAEARTSERVQAAYLGSTASVHGKAL